MAKGRKGILGPQKVITKKKHAAQPSAGKAPAPETSERRKQTGPSGTSGPSTKVPQSGGGGKQSDTNRHTVHPRRHSSSAPHSNASASQRAGTLGPQKMINKVKGARQPPSSRAQQSTAGRDVVRPRKFVAKTAPAGQLSRDRSPAASAPKPSAPRRHTQAASAAGQAGGGQAANRSDAAKAGQSAARKRSKKPSQRQPSSAPQDADASIPYGSGGKLAGRKRSDLQDLIPELKAPADVDLAAAQPSGVAPPGASNWELLKGRIARTDAAKASAGAGAGAAARFHDARRHRKATQQAVAAAAAAANGVVSEGVLDGKLVPKGPDTSHTRVLAMDCEMVGVGVTSARSALARVCIVNDFGNVLLDLYVKPKEKVTDYRTQYSGIRPKDLAGAASLEEAMRRVHDLLKGHVLVGHALHNDFKALMLEGVIPAKDLRDTAVYEPLMAATVAGGKLRSRALRVLVREELGLEIQAGEHSPVEDSRAALYIYHKHKSLWEAKIKAGLIKPRSLKSSGKIATGATRMKGPRATEAHVQQKVAAEGGAAGEDDEFARPSLEAIARMQAHMTGAAPDIYADR